MIDSLLLTSARVLTFGEDRQLTNATGFFFERDERLFLVTSRHVVIDKPSDHHPTRLEVALVEIERAALPEGTLFRAFTPRQLQEPDEIVEVGTSLLVVGFPLGFHDTLHHMPVVRRAGLASCFGLRFGGQGYFLTDGRTHRGTSGAPVVMRAAGRPSLPWRLLGVHSARLDVGTRDLELDEALGLNCAWYADILLTLSED
jgi:S1-C subfamily serine protease